MTPEAVYSDQARVMEAGQALLRRTQGAAGLGPRWKGRRSGFHMDAYEKHMLLPEASSPPSLPLSPLRQPLNAAPQLFLWHTWLSSISSLACLLVDRPGVGDLVHFDPPSVVTPMWQLKWSAIWYWHQAGSKEADMVKVGLCRMIRW